MLLVLIKKPLDGHLGDPRHRDVVQLGERLNLSMLGLAEIDCDPFSRSHWSLPQEALHRAAPCCTMLHRVIDQSFQIKELDGGTKGLRAENGRPAASAARGQQPPEPRLGRADGYNRLPIITFSVKDTPATRGPAAPPLERPAATARRLAAASLSPNTRRAYAGALHRLDAWLDRRDLDDATFALYLAELHDAGRAPASAALAVAAAGFRARLAGQPPPGGPRTARVLAGYRRTAAERGRGQAPPFGAPSHATCRAVGKWPAGTPSWEGGVHVAAVPEAGCGDAGRAALVGRHRLADGSGVQARARVPAAAAASSGCLSGPITRVM